MDVLIQWVISLVSVSVNISSSRHHVVRKNNDLSPCDEY